LVNDVLSSDEDRVNDAIEKKAESFYNILKIKGEKLDKEQLQRSIDRAQSEVDFINRIIAGNNQIIEQHKSIKDTRAAELRNEKATVELIERKGKLLAMQRFAGVTSLGQDPLNANAGRDDEAETEKVVKKQVKTTQKILDKPENKIKINADINVGGVSLTEKPEKAAEEIVQAITKIENSPEFTRAESQREVDRQEQRKKERDEKDEQARKDKELLYSNTINLAREAQNQIDIEQNKTDRLIALQEKRVSAAEKNSAVSLKVEQDRLDELLKKRQNYERAQRVIDAAVITANQALAISGAIATIANSKNPVLIAANVIAILAGIGAVIGSIRSINAESGFKEGGYTGEGNPNETSTAIGRRPYKYHKKEFVMNEQLTSKNRDMFEGLHRGELMVKQLEDGSYYLTRNRIDTDAVVSDHNKIKSDNTLYPLLNEMSSIRKLLESREVNINNTFDAEGFGQSVATSLGQSQIKFMRR